MHCYWRIIHEYGLSTPHGELETNVVIVLKLKILFFLSTPHGELETLYSLVKIIIFPDLSTPHGELETGQRIGLTDRVKLLSTPHGELETRGFLFVVIPFRGFQLHTVN